MAKKEKLNIQKDKRMEPIDNELDAALGLLENANRQITDLLASFAPVTPGPEDVEEAETAVVDATGTEAKPEAKEPEAAPAEQ
jgi:hypothetical protein